MFQFCFFANINICRHHSNFSAHSGHTSDWPRHIEQLQPLLTYLGSSALFPESSTHVSCTAPHNTQVTRSLPSSHGGRNLCDTDRLPMSLPLHFIDILIRLNCIGSMTISPPLDLIRNPLSSLDSVISNVCSGVLSFHKATKIISPSTLPVFIIVSAPSL